MTGTNDSITKFFNDIACSTWTAANSDVIRVHCVRVGGCACVDPDSGFPQNTLIRRILVKSVEL